MGYGMDDDEDIFTLVITWYRYGSHDGNAISIQKITTKKKESKRLTTERPVFFFFLILLLLSPN